MKKLAATAAFVLLLSTALSVTPAGAGLAMRLLEMPAAQPSGREQAIVLLSGHMRRLPLAIDLERRTHLPVIVSGAYTDDYVEALRLAGVREVVVEDRSIDTEQNAAFTSCRARARGIGTVFLVTDSMHMRRASAWFAHYGIRTTAAPVPGRAQDGIWPSRAAAHATRGVLHEWLGLAELAFRVMSGRRIAC